MTILIIIGIVFCLGGIIYSLIIIERVENTIRNHISSLVEQRMIYVNHVLSAFQKELEVKQNKRRSK